MNYKQADEFIASIPKFTTKNKPEHTKNALKRLGNPQDSFRVIHVAGTNGKGSVCAFLASVLKEAGYQTGLFISPHLVKINERFQINGEDISDEEFLSAFHEVKKISEQLVEEGEPHPTYFEFLFLLGMVVYRERKVDFVVLETGLGGRLDATNVIENPLLSVIASISLDHTEILGETIELIAAEKAGIIKKEVPVVYNALNKEASAVIENRAKELKTKTWKMTAESFRIVRNTPEGIDFSYKSRYYGIIDIHIPYIAAYQVENAALALLALDTLFEGKLSGSVIQKGFRNVKWQGRMETILPGVIVDGAHNADGIERFVETAAHFAKDYQLTLLFSAVVEKDYQKMIQTICEKIPWSSIVVTQISGSRVVAAKELADLFCENTSACVYTEPDVTKAFEKACEQKKDGLLFCVGSLYLVGEIKEYLALQGGMAQREKND